MAGATNSNFNDFQTDVTALLTAESLPKLDLYVDGSCLKNGTAAAEAGAGVVFVTADCRHIKLKACYLGALTNNQAEIVSAAIGLESLRKPCRVEIYTDSKYVVETMLGKSRMKANREFWQRLVQASLTHKIGWNWIRGHVGNPFQETADRLSRAAAIAKTDLSRNVLDKLGTLLRGEPSAEVAAMIHDGIKILAARCDGANRADRRGFNKFDSELGHRFAQKPNLTVAETFVARKLLTKYRTQIAVFNQELALLV